MWLCFSMHHGVLSLGHLGEPSPSCRLYILPFHIMPLKNQPSGQGLQMIHAKISCNDINICTLYIFAFCLFIYLFFCGWLPSFLAFEYKILKFLQHFEYKILKFLQHSLKIWSSWISYSFYSKFYDACSISWLSDPSFTRCFLWWCYW